ncbi:hypothetical protein KRX51_07030 [Corynebacterium sp. TAE3-ERU12]|uniref:hypothetical protein n=1 Tax=Corynebacterium sp. TAE3-ERU12 TaxID=2849491 RepID=UPI001C4763AD|nr:hypothetical protein [Corynebacterium sp. TAE3-ERU12]MBV7295667.1 hypothetical protein [Corynebacterium sp. TAE3-ERU12]
MFHALAYALIDSINVLLIGVLVALGITVPAGRYRRVAPLLVIGDWLGVLVPALLVLLVFDGNEETVRHVVESPIFGWLLLITGVATAILTVRGGDSSGIVQKILGPLQHPSPLTVVIGFGLGAIQSLTSVPFFAGLAVLSAEGLPAFQRYAGLPLYAMVALSIPTLCGLGIAVVRHRPASLPGRIFAAARRNQVVVGRAAGYLVAVLLVVIGAFRIWG